MGRLACGGLLLALVGCFAPSPSPGGPCSALGTCPTGLVCVADVCVKDPLAIDAPVDTPRGDVPTDVPAIDGPIDGPIDGAIDAPIDAPGPSLTWATPVPVAGLDLPAIAETDPSWTPDRLTIVYCSGEDIFLGTRPTTTSAFVASALTALNSPTAVERTPRIDATGTTIYFTSDRLAAGSSDVYVSTKSGGTWSAPTIVLGLSSAADEGDVGISPDGLTAIVVRGNGLYRSTRATTGSTWGVPTLLSGSWGAGPASATLNAAGDLYFHATVAANRDLFVARKSGATFTAPTAITELNTAGRDAAPFISADDLYLVFDRDSHIYETWR